jgi:hypothetical protein
MKELLIFIEINNFVRYKDGRYYKPGSYRPYSPTKYYTIDELLDLFNNAKMELLIDNKI